MREKIFIEKYRCKVNDNLSKSNLKTMVLNNCIFFWRTVCIFVPITVHINPNFDYINQLTTFS
jgi:hypothetical protein